MINYSVSFYPGIVIPPAYIVLDERTTDYGIIIDILIDVLEDAGYEFFFDDGEEMPDDMVVIGGNHGRRLITGGIFNIQEIETIDKSNAWLVANVAA